MIQKWPYLMLLLAGVALAAQALAARGYERLTFPADASTELKVTSQGNALNLHFSKPVTLDANQIRSTLGTRAKNITIEPNRKHVVITLDQPYRTRQFISGNTVGLDILTGDTKAPVASIMTTKDAMMPEAAEPASKSAEKPLLTTKEPEKKPKPVAPTAAATPALETPKAPAADDTAKLKEEMPAPKVAESEATRPTIESESAPPPPATTDGKFTVTTRATDDGVWMYFPWAERVATAVFRRGDDLWIVFSRPQAISTALLHSNLPKSVISVDQFASQTHTILRLSTDGNLQATARQPKGSYRWDILLSPRTVEPNLETAISVQEEDSKAYLLLELYDTTKPLRFYDPRIGDLVLVFPAYEEGRGVSSERQYPGFSILKTQQGLTVTSARDDLTAHASRVGVRLEAASGLPISLNLPAAGAATKPLPSGKENDIMFPYDAWFVAPADYQKVRAERLRNITNATPAAKPDALFSMVTLALSQGYATEALGYLDLIRLQFPDYYRVNRLALLRAASNLLLYRPQEAKNDASAPELDGLAEAQLWREAIGLYFPVVAQTPAQPVSVDDKAIQQGTLNNAGVAGDEPNAASATVMPSAKPFDYLQYDAQYIRFYPPRIRQHLAQLAAEYYLKTNDADKALAVYDTLNRDGILKPIQSYAELTLGTVAARKSQVKQAVEILERLASQQQDRFIQARADYEGIMLRYKNGMLSIEQTTEALERLRLRWRGDWFERKLLDELVRLYMDNKQYDEVLRIQKYTLAAFPGDPDALKIAGDMSQLFADMFLSGLADDMPPLKSLALFYEFRELTPIGERGDAIIQKLADRLASVDLLDRAAQLLEHQVKSRVSGEMRARVGARLALLYLLNREPQRALDVLQTTNYGSAPAELTRERQQLLAQALSGMGKPEDGLSMLFSDSSREGSLLRLDILWSMQDWPNVVNQAEDILAARANLTDPLTEQETQVLLKLALAYSFEGDYTQLGYLRDYYMGLVPDSPMKEIFAFITNDTSPLDPEDIALVTRQIQNTEGFLGLFKEKIAAGRLSEAL